MNTTRYGLRPLTAVLLPLAAAALVACGGGGGGSSSGTGTGTGGGAASSFARGTITGFGSIFVNGVEYDTSHATIKDDDGNVQNESALHLGMTVEVSGTDATGANGMSGATTVIFNSSIVGPVGSIDTAASTLTLFGQTVDVTALTSFDTTLTGGLAGLSPGQVLKVYALYDAATDHYVASRIEADGGAANFKLRGMATALDTTAKTYQVGTTVIDYSAVTAPPPGLADNVVVTAILKTTPNADGSWPATALKLRNAGVPGDKVVVHVRGLVGAFVSLSSFTVDGVPVDASAATLPQGSAGIVSGASVQVDGVMNKGLLIASQVSVMAPGAHGGQDFELHGTVSNLDTTAQTFQVRSVPVSYAGTVTYAGGTAADLGSAKSVLVEGTLSSDGTSVQATHIRLYM